MMEFRLVKKLFGDGFFQSALIVQAPMSDKFHLCFITSTGSTERMTKTRKTDIKEYRTETSALIEAKNLGFRKITVEYEQLKSA